jgi:hypothetical protein
LIVARILLRCNIGCAATATRGSAEAQGPGTLCLAAGFYAALSFLLPGPVSSEASRRERVGFLIMDSTALRGSRLRYSIPGLAEFPIRLLRATHSDAKDDVGKGEAPPARRFKVV